MTQQERKQKNREAALEIIEEIRQPRHCWKLEATADNPEYRLLQLAGMTRGAASDPDKFLDRIFDAVEFFTSEEDPEQDDEGK